MLLFNLRKRFFKLPSFVLIIAEDIAHVILAASLDGCRSIILINHYARRPRLQEHPARAFGPAHHRACPVVNLVHLVEEAIFLDYGIIELKLGARIIEICIMRRETLLDIILADEA